MSKFAGRPIDKKVRQNRQNDLHREANNESKKYAHNSMDEWTDAQLDRVMDDEVSERGGVTKIAKELGRSKRAVHDKRVQIKSEWVKELDDDSSYRGPRVAGVSEETDEATLRTASLVLTGIGVGKGVTDPYDYMSLYAMLGLME